MHVSAPRPVPPAGWNVPWVLPIVEDLMSYLGDVLPPGVLPTSLMKSSEAWCWVRVMP